MFIHYNNTYQQRLILHLHIFFCTNKCVRFHFYIHYYVIYITVTTDLYVHTCVPDVLVFRVVYIIIFDVHKTRNTQNKKLQFVIVSFISEYMLQPRYFSANKIPNTQWCIGYIDL